MPFILVIDDEDFRNILRLTLEEAGYFVWTARSGPDGLQIHANEPVDLVLCDVYMEPMDGLETIQRLQRRQPGLKIVAMSGVARFGWSHLQQAEALGAVASLKKPFDADVLLNTIRNALQAMRN